MISQGEQIKLILKFWEREFLLGSVLLLLVLLLLLLLHLLILLLSQISCSKCTSPPSWRHVFQMHQTTLHPICTLHTIQPAHTESKHWIHFTAIHWSKNPLEHKSVGTSPLEQESIRAKIHLNKNPDIKMVFCERDFINLHFFFFTKYRFLLDAIASPSTFPCQSVSGSVTVSDLKIAIASSSFASLF